MAEIPEASKLSVKPWHQSWIWIIITGTDKRLKLEPSSSGLAGRWQQRGFLCDISIHDASDTRSTTCRHRRSECPCSKTPVENKNLLFRLCSCWSRYYVVARYYTLMPSLCRMPTRRDRTAGGTHRGSPQPATMAGLRMSHNGRQPFCPRSLDSEQARQGQQNSP